jgi:hypothetical protein
LTSQTGTADSIVEIELDSQQLLHLGEGRSALDELDRGFNPYDTGTFRAVAHSARVASQLSGKGATAQRR